MWERVWCGPTRSRSRSPPPNVKDEPPDDDDDDDKGGGKKRRAKQLPLRAFGKDELLAELYRRCIY